jgi:O-antigen/teichoic acid export membrane protein
MSTVFSTTVYSFANVMAYAFDPIIVAAFLTSRDVSAFGLASRITTLAMLLPLALGGLISARVNSWRGQTAWGDLYHRVSRLCLQMGAAGAIVSALAVSIGPVIGRWLGRGVIDTPFTLYLAFGAYAVVSSATAPIFALFSGPGVARFRAVVVVGAGIANLGLSSLLIYPLGVAGPVVASLICLVAMALVLLRKTRHGMDAIMMIHA